MACKCMIESELGLGMVLLGMLLLGIVLLEVLLLEWLLERVLAGIFC